MTCEWMCLKYISKLTIRWKTGRRILIRILWNNVTLQNYNYFEWPSIALNCFEECGRGCQKPEWIEGKNLSHAYHPLHESFSQTSIFYAWINDKNKKKSRINNFEILYKK